MGFFYVSLPKSIRWNIHKDAAAAHELSSYPGWFFINPLSYEYKEQPLVIIEDTTLIEVPYLIFLPPKGTTVRELDKNVFSNYLEAFLKGIRYFSKQAELIGMEVASVYEQTPLFEELVEVPRFLNWPRPNLRGSVGV